MSSLHFLHRMNRRSLMAAAACAAFLAPTLASAQSLSLATLMQSLSKEKERHGKFVETKHLKVLSKPLRSSGTVYYNAPNVFEKKTLEPTPELVRVNGNSLLLERGTRKMNIQLSSQPQVAAFVSAVAGLLTGDARMLEQNYQYQLMGSVNNWTITLTPKDSRMKSYITEIVAGGDQSQVRRIDYRQADGDSASMVIEPLKK